MEPNQFEQIKKIATEAKTKKFLEDIAQEINDKKDSDDNSGGGSSFGLSVKLVLITAPAAITYFSQKEEEENKEILAQLRDLFAQFSINPTAEAIKEIQLLIAKVKEIKQKETGKGFEDLIDIEVMEEIKIVFSKKGSLEDSIDRLEKKSIDLKL